MDQNLPEEQRATQPAIEQQPMPVQPTTNPVTEAPLLSKHFHFPRVFLIIIIALVSGAFCGMIGYFIGVTQEVQLANQQKTVENMTQASAKPKTQPTQATGSAVKNTTTVSVTPPVTQIAPQTATSTPVITR